MITVTASYTKTESILSQLPSISIKSRLSTTTTATATWQCLRRFLPSPLSMVQKAVCSLPSSLRSTTM